MDIKELTITFTIEADTDAYGFLEHILSVDGQHTWPDCLVGTLIVSDTIRQASPDECEWMGYGKGDE